MSDNTQLATSQQTGITMADQMAWANQAAKASIIPQAYIGKPANVLIAVGFGQSMGLSPAESLYRINVIQGKPTMSAELIAAQVRKAGHKLRLQKDAKAMSVTCTIVRCDDSDYPVSVTRDAKWAKDMGLSTKDNYKKQPLTMLTWRAITACAREACPEALYGVAYTPDEMHDFDAPLDVQATITDAPMPDAAVVDTINRKDAKERMWAAVMDACKGDKDVAMAALTKAAHGFGESVTPADLTVEQMDAIAAQLSTNDNESEAF